MSAFIRTDQDPEGKRVCIRNAFKSANGKHYLLLHRLPPEYLKGPVFLVELSADRMEVRGETSGPVYFKAYAYQSLSADELKLLAKAKPGKTVLPFLNFSYPNVIRILGKQFECLSEDKMLPLVQSRTWKLVGGMRE